MRRLLLLFLMPLLSIDSLIMALPQEQINIAKGVQQAELPIQVGHSFLIAKIKLNSQKVFSDLTYNYTLGKFPSRSSRNDANSELCKRMCG